MKFAPSSFGVPPGLVRTVDLPFETVVEENGSSGVPPRPVERSTRGKLSAHSAFRRQMFGVPSETKLPEIVEENKEAAEVASEPLVGVEGMIVVALD